MPETTESSFEKKDAERLARSFNVMYNNCNLYGGAHPTTLKSAKVFGDMIRDMIRDMIKDSERITLIRQGKSYYFENICVDSILKLNKIIPDWESVGLQSVSFEREITDRDIAAFIKVFGIIDQLNDVEELKSKFSDYQGENIKFNYFQYKKIAEDETVLDRESAESAGQKGEETAKEVRETLDELITLRQMFEQGEDSISAMVRSSFDQNQEEKQETAEKIREMKSRVSSDRDIDLNQVADMVTQMKSEMTEAINVQKETGKIYEQDNPVVDEIEELSFKTVLEIVRKEYRENKSISVPKLSRLIKRVLPDIKDVHKLLPQLKSILLHEGMGIGDYLELVKNLKHDTSGEAVSNALKDAGESFGVSVDDLVKGITENPEEAAKLIVMASEHAKDSNLYGNKSLSEILADYVGNVSGRMAVESQDGAVEDGPLLDTTVLKIEKLMLNRLREQGISDTVLDQVKNELQDGLPGTLNNAKAAWIKTAVNEIDGEITSDKILSIVERVMDQDNDIEEIKKVLNTALQNKGMDENGIDSVFKEISDKISRAGMPKLPKGIMNITNTAYFIQQEIKKNLRYGHPFSVLMITVTDVYDQTGWRKVGRYEMSNFNNEIFKTLRSMLRDIDIIGTYGSGITLIPLLILPMTDDIGAVVVKKRIADVLKKKKLEYKDRQMVCNPVISYTTFDKEIGVTLASFRERLKSRHRKAELIMRK